MAIEGMKSYPSDLKQPGHRQNALPRMLPLLAKIFLVSNWKEAGFLGG